MEVINAYWENENLEKKTYEMILSHGDSFEEFLSVEHRLISIEKAEYLVVKVPINIPKLLFSLPEAGYIFVETSFEINLKANRYVCPPLVERFDHDIIVTELSGPSGLELIFSEISKGMFNTDRISVDINFNSKLAGRRYINWIKALIQQGQKVFEVSKSGEAIGFFIIKHIDEKNVRGILTGLYEKHQQSGYGNLIMKKLNDTVWRLGYKTYHAQVVSNNLKALRANLQFGSVIDNMTYTYVKHVVQEK